MTQVSDKTLVIVESPAKCKKIEGFLGPGYKCMASFGHITTLANLKNVDVENNFTPTFTQIDSKRQHISQLRQFIKQAKEVVLATDDDREGEAIAWHICQQFKLPVSKTKRIIFHEITKTAITQAIKAPTIVNMQTVHAQQARQILDLIVGFKLSPVLWSHITRKSKTGLSAGRCQTPALGIIYDNYKEIQKSPGKLAYNTTGYFTNQNIPFNLNYHFEESEKMAEFLENSVEHEHVFSRGKVRKSTKNPPKPFTTSTLQQTANTELRISPKEVMSICQDLYQRGKITYMRTDSKIYSKEFIDKAAQFINKRWGQDYVHENIESLSENSKSKSKSKSKKEKEKEKDSNAQEAHEAIRPTNVNLDNINDEDDCSAKTKKLYKLIWRNTVESCMAAAKADGITSEITAPEKLIYKHSTEQITFGGWKVVKGYDEDNPIYNYITLMKNNTIIAYNKITAKVSLKDIKSHYTEAKLVQLLEEKGIGRPSTFSSLVEKIQERGYVKRENVKGKMMSCIDFELEDCELSEIEHKKEFGNEKNKLVIQSLGILVIEFLLQHFKSFFNYDYTKNMEEQLDKIAEGNEIWYELCRECYNEIDELLVPLQTSAGNDKVRVEIDANHTYMVSKYGPVIKYTKGDITEFKNVKKNLDIEKLKNGEYSLEDILQEHTNISLGVYKGEKLYIKKGKYGYFVQCGEKKHSLAQIEKDVLELTIEDVVEYINKPKDILREITKEASLRKSKYGFYIFHKSVDMKKPKFISLKNFKLDPITCPVEDLCNLIN